MAKILFFVCLLRYLIYILFDFTFISITENYFYQFFVLVKINNQSIFLSQIESICM